MKKSLLALFSVILLTVVVFGAGTIKAASVGVSGYAWSSNIGWIWFDTGVGSPAGVNIDDASGDWSGYAWSSNIGWINFGTNACGAGGHTNFATGQTIGWAEALTADGNGWDGCIELSGTNHSSPDPSGNGGVTYNPATGVFNGYAWGGPVVGWVQFNTGVGVQVRIDPVGGQPAPVVTGSCSVISVNGQPVPPASYNNLVPNTLVRFRTTPSSGTASYEYNWNGSGTSTSATPNEYEQSYPTTPPAGPTVRIGDSALPVNGYSASIQCPQPTILPPITTSDVKISRTVAGLGNPNTSSTLIVSQGDSFVIGWSGTATDDHTATVSISPATSNPGFAGWTDTLFEVNSTNSTNGTVVDNGDGTITWNGNTGSSLTAGTSGSTLPPGLYQFTITFDNGDGSPQTATATLRVVQTTETEI